MSVAAYLQGFAQAQATNTLPFARLSLGVTTGEMSQILAVTRFGSVLALAFSFYGDRHGRRAPFLSAFTILILANAATAFVPNPTVYTALQGIVRMTATAVGVLALVYLAEELAPTIRAYGIAIYGGAASFGAGTAPSPRPNPRPGDICSPPAPSESSSSRSSTQSSTKAGPFVTRPERRISSRHWVATISSISGCSPSSRCWPPPSRRSV